jgi:hypothetical protein
MTVSSPDVHDRLEYRAAAEIVRLLPTGLFLIFAGLFIFALVNLDREPWTLIGIILCWVFGIGVSAVALCTRSNPGKPLFTLSPAGIHYRIPWVEELLIPWCEIQAVDTIDVATGHWSFYWYTRIPTPKYNAVNFRNVTVVLVSKQFYDAQIFIDSFFLRGPGWKANFIPKGELVQVALHHELVSVEPQALRHAVETRWHAFRGRPVAAPARTSVPSVTAAQTIDAPGSVAAYAVAMGDSPKAMTTWEAVKIAVPLIGIAAMLANLAGLWQLPGQSAERAVRAKAREERKHWEESNRRMREEWKKGDAEEKKRQTETEDLMRRTFGR